MNVGDINKGAVALILVLLLGAGGYLWYSMMYKPAVADKATAVGAATTAEAGLETAKQELAAAQKRIEDAEKGDGKLDDSVPRLAKARAAIPTKDQLDDAAIVLMEVAQKSGITTDFKAGNEENKVVAAPVASSSLQGATPIDIEFKAAGTYAEMMHFISLVEGTVAAKDGKLYSKGRLFNVVKVEIGGDAPAASAVDNIGLGSGTNSAGNTNLGPIPKRGEIPFKITVRMYTSTTQNSQSVGEAATDAAAAGTGGANGAATPATGGATTPTGTSTTGAAGGATTPTSGAVTTPGTGSSTGAPAGGQGTSGTPSTGTPGATTPAPTAGGQ